MGLPPVASAASLTASLSVGLCGELLELSAQLLLLSEALVELLPQRLIAQPLLHRADAPADARRETGKLVLHRKDLGDIEEEWGRVTYGTEWVSGRRTKAHR